MAGKDKVEQKPFTEFQALPLELMIATPLIAAVRAQAAAAEATLKFIEELKDASNAEFKLKAQDPQTGAVEKTISVPKLALVPVPHLRIDSIHIGFRFEVRQVSKVTKETAGQAELKVGTGAALSPWVEGSLHGSISTRTASESESNRSGTYEVAVQASEAPIPEGLARVLSALTAAIRTE
ncbi:MAG: DUF2589 domain-containing protein [Myxococcota bacterium]